MSNLKMTSTYINADIHTDLKLLLLKYDISLREFIEYSYLFVKDDTSLQQNMLIETKYKILEIKNGKLE